MQKMKMMIAVLGAMFALPAYAEDSPHTLTSNVGFVSDYVFNGISQNFRNPSLQGGFDYSHSSGLYLGTWASNISSNQYTNSTLEWDFYGGYKTKVANDAVELNAGLMHVYYPDGKTSVAPPNHKWDTSEFLLGATWNGLNAKITQTFTDWYGINAATGFAPRMWNPGDTAATGATGPTTANYANAGSKGSRYVELNYSYEFPEKLTVSAHVGHQKVANFSLLSYTDYKLGVTKDVNGFVFGLAYTKTNATDNSLYDVSNGVDRKNLRGNIVAVSVNRSF